MHTDIPAAASVFISVNPWFQLLGPEAATDGDHAPGVVARPVPCAVLRGVGARRLCGGGRRGAVRKLAASGRRGAQLSAIVWSATRERSAGAGDFVLPGTPYEVAVDNSIA